MKNGLNNAVTSDRGECKKNAECVKGKKMMIIIPAKIKLLYIMCLNENNKLIMTAQLAQRLNDRLPRSVSRV